VHLFLSKKKKKNKKKNNTTTKSVSFDDDDDACYNLDELFDDDRPSNRKTLFDVSKKAQKNVRKMSARR
jgi:hypothetical protein